MRNQADFLNTLGETTQVFTFLLSGIAAWTRSLGEESPLAGAAWVPVTLLGIGLLMLAFAVVTMLLVRGQLAASAGT